MEKRSKKVVTGPPKSTEFDGIVTISVGTRGPYGFVLEPDSSGRSGVIKAWEKLPGGKSGPVERHGGVRLGDVLIGVNDIATAELPFRQVLELTRDDDSLRKSLHFCSFAELERRRGAFAEVGPSTARRRFVSRVRRARVAEMPVGSRRASAPFAEYEVVCSLRLDATKVEHDMVKKWVIWRRYSDFERVDSALRPNLGWRMNDVGPFPPKHHFCLDKLSPEFIEKRRAELDDYWQRLIVIDGVCDFHRPHDCQPSLAAFVDSENQLSFDNKDDDDESGADSSSSDNIKPVPAMKQKKLITAGKRGRPVSLKSKRRLTNNDNRTNTTKEVVAPPPQQDKTPPPPPPTGAPKTKTPPPPPPATQPKTQVPAALPPAVVADPRRNALMAAIRAT